MNPILQLIKISWLGTVDNHPQMTIQGNIQWSHVKIGYAPPNGHDNQLAYWENFSFNNCLTGREKWAEVPSCWKK